MKEIASSPSAPRKDVILCFFLLFTAYFASPSFAQDVTYPTASGYVVDQSGIIDSDTKSKLEGWILELKQKTTAEVAVVTVDSTEPLPIEEYAVNLFQRFGIGQKGKDNGVLLLIAYKDRHMRIEVVMVWKARSPMPQVAKLLTPSSGPHSSKVIIPKVLKKGLRLLSV